MDNEISAKMLIMSHLSDAQELVSFGFRQKANREINFAKFVLLNCENTKETVDADKLYAKFCEKFPE